MSTTDAEPYVEPTHNFHVVDIQTVSGDGAVGWGLIHPKVCNAVEGCTYLDSITEEAVADLAQQGAPLQHKVTGTTSPVYSKMDTQEVPVSEGEGSEDPDVIYDEVDRTDEIIQSIEQPDSTWPMQRP